MNMENVKYGYLNLEVKGVENINLSINDKIDSLLTYVPDIEDKEEAISALLDFMLDMRVQANLLDTAIDKLKQFNKDYILNVSRKPDEQIKPHSDKAFKMAQIEFRY